MSSSAFESLMEGLEETFTVNRLHLKPTLMRGLATTPDNVVSLS
ncbi:MAG: hypothetical protein ACYCS1_05955 [Gammaproteobacteria bacterium]